MARKATRKSVPKKAARGTPPSKARAAARPVRRRAAASDAQRIDLVMRAINEGVYDWDVASNTVYYSDWVRRALGLSEQELRTPSDWRNRIHPDDVGRFDAALVAHFKGETDRFQCEFRYRSADGSWRWARQHGFSIRDRRGRAVRMIGSTGDVTELKQATEALRASEERYALATRAATEGVYEWDLASGRLFISDTTKLFFWSKDATLTPGSWNDRVHPEDFAAYRAAITDHFRGRTAQFEHEYRIRGADGAYLWVLDRGVGVRGADGRIVKFVGAVSDITPRKNAEAAAQRAHEETTQALERQTATAEILKVIASTPSDVQPVFDAIVGAVARLFGRKAALRTVDADGLRRRARSYDPEPGEYHGREVETLDRSSIVGEAVLEGRALQWRDTLVEGAARYGLEQAKKLAFRSIASAPLMLHGRAIGVISVSSPEPGLLSDKQMELLATFADQAVIAIENARLFNETKEALERQTATADILKVIAGSPSDAEPVFGSIAESAHKLFGGAEVGLTLIRGDQIELVAAAGLDAARLGALRASFPRPLDLDSAVNLTVVHGRTVHYPDVAAADAPSFTRATLKAAGMRAMLGVPLLREGKSIGGVFVSKPAPGAYTDKQMELLATFADQAVIAIENARLFNETREALERQTATAEILKVIASSPSDVQPVFDAIARSAMRLVGGQSCSVTRVVGDHLHLAALTSTGPNADDLVRSYYPMSLQEPQPMARVVRAAKPLLVRDTETDPVFGEEGRQIARARGFRTIVYVPMVREGAVVGVIHLAGEQPGTISDSHLLLLQTFADQAAIAIENTRLFNETQEALERQTATAEILKVIAESPDDVQPVFDAIARNCGNLFPGSLVLLWLIEDGVLRARAMTGAGDLQLLGDRLPIDRGSAIGTCVVESRMVHLSDLEKALGMHPRIRQLGLKWGHRSGIYAPLMREARAIGAIAVLRPEIGAFDDEEVALLNTFANQAVIAIENVRLFNETKEALERQTATAEILRVISNSPADTQPVFEAILEKATQLCDAEMGILFSYDGDQYRAMSMRIPDPAFAAVFREPRRAGPTTGLGRIARDLKSVHIHDVLDDAAYHQADPMRLETARLGGVRTWLGVPMLKEGALIGAIVIYRKEVRPFATRQMDLLETFADQAVIAIENVRLFNETKEALERQTATSDVLASISGSMTDAQPVFDRIVRNVRKLFGTRFAVLQLLQGNQVEMPALDGDPGFERLRDHYPRPLDDATVGGRAMLEKQVVQFTPVIGNPAAPRAAQDFAREIGFDSVLFAPMVQGDRVIGAIGAAHPDAKPFDERQVALIRTFADQAVIAIANVRLFTTIRQRNEDLARLLERQTAMADLLRAAAASPADVRPVLNALAEHAARLCSATYVNVLLEDRGRLHTMAVFSAAGGPPPDLGFSVPATPATVNGRAFLERRSIHVEDFAALAETEYPDALAMQRQFGFRTILGVPMLREGKAIGTISIWRREVRPFAPEEIALMQTFANQAVIAIENTRLLHEVQAKSAQLEIANKHKSDFLAHMSHELRTPLNAIIGFSEVLGERYFGELTDKQDEYVKDIHASGKHLLSLINDILDLSKIEAGRMELEPSDFDLRAAIDNALTLIKERAQRHGLALHCEIDDTLGTLRADERKFKQVLVNLLSNAVKFTPDGGSIRVSARPAGPMLEIAVSDTGPGIAPEDQAAVFEEFKQVGPASAAKAEGTGLGMPLTKRIVELHGGSIRLESAPGQGATFTVCLPLSGAP